MPVDKSSASIVKLCPVAPLVAHLDIHLSPGIQMEGVGQEGVVVQDDLDRIGARGAFMNVARAFSRTTSEHHQDHREGEDGRA